MDLPELRDICLSHPGSAEGMPFGPEVLVYKAGSKIFAILSETDGVASISLKCDPYIAQHLRETYPSVQPGYHLNKKHWNTIVSDGTVPDEEIVKMIGHSYGLILKSLPRAEREKIPRSGK
ncbi:MAG: MmcQ-like protein [Spirochaetes bacterium GWF1_51_8]|nr:MAG: MmcQ-like protein [Spirochaetes bacterium GWF1_51_8]